MSFVLLERGAALRAVAFVPCPEAFFGPALLAMTPEEEDDEENNDEAEAESSSESTLKGCWLCRGGTTLLLSSISRFGCLTADLDPEVKSDEIGYGEARFS